MPLDAKKISAIRAFNRFYTRQIGLLDEGLLKSKFSLTEVRVLYELAQRDNLAAADLKRDLGLDEGYLSRLLKKLENGGMVQRTTSQKDGRQSLLSLTDEGRAVFEPLEQSSQAQVKQLIAPLSKTERQRLVSAMRTIQELLEAKPQPKVPYLLRPPHLGDVSWIVHRQSVLYGEEQGWNDNYEALVSEIAGAFMRNFNADKERCWIAEREGEIVGSVFVVHQSDDVAKLRLLYVEPCARGLGIGAKLVDECIRFARGKGYKTMTLWTTNAQASARKIYEAVGFKLVKSEPDQSFGKELMGQTWELSLTKSSVNNNTQMANAHGEKFTRA
ncbi:MAG: bifunctional helix-turn-helix transcriptional regulator/GNAT family N-acetyltransferase [Candidatus Obscuribacterales bacterium]|nr:bifunctional helix-turn-helix transcriptional regulator/GNAT family N-acetyltransferase [Candidatus Obscuribacterales bacterium]